LSELRMHLGLGVGCGKCMKQASHLLKQQQSAVQKSSRHSHSSPLHLVF
jgi:bacterioferritin-associated ferredoxin